MGVFTSCRQDSYKDTLRMQSELLAGLIIQSRSVVLDVVGMEGPHTFTVEQKRQAETEMIAYTYLFSKHMLLKHTDDVHFRDLSETCRFYLEDYLWTRSSDYTLCHLFQEAKSLLEGEVTTSPPNPFLPGFRASYERQCRFLGVPPESAVRIVPSQSLLIKMMARWDLHEIRIENA